MPESRFPFGAVLTVLQSDSPEESFTALSAMKQAGLDTVVLWPAFFWWEDRKSPDYPFSRGGEILREAGRLGLSVIVELAGQIPSLEYMPDFMMRDEFLPENFDGSPNYDYTFVYGYPNFNHPEVKTIVAEKFSRAAKFYSGFPALIAYDVWNETMFHSYDDYTLREFQLWLKARYGRIEDLNRIWARSFGDWNQIRFQKWMWASVMPVVDFARFQRANVAAIVSEMRAAVRASNPVHEVIADNIGSELTNDWTYERPQDNWGLARAADRFGVSMYPKSYLNADSEWRRSLVYEASRAAGGKKGFWVSELQTHNRSLFNPGSSVTAPDLYQWTWEAVFGGASGLIYWKWEPFRTGLQTLGRGIVDPAGRPTPRSDQVEKIARLLPEISSVLASAEPLAPRAGLLFDPENQDFIRAYVANYTAYASQNFYIESLRNIYRCLWNFHCPVSVVNASDFVALASSGEPVLPAFMFVSSQLLLGKALSDAIVAYVESGGTLIVDGRFGIVDENGRTFGELPGGPISAWLGLDFRDQDADCGDIRVNTGEGREFSLPSHFERQVLSARDSGVRVVGTFPDGREAVFERRRGRGRIMVFASCVWFEAEKSAFAGIESLLSDLDSAGGLRSFEFSPDRVRAWMFSTSNGPVFGLINYSAGQETALIRWKSKEDPAKLGSDSRVGPSPEWAVLDLISGNRGLAEGESLTWRLAAGEAAFLVLSPHARA